MQNECGCLSVDSQRATHKTSKERFQKKKKKGWLQDLIYTVLASPKLGRHQVEIFPIKCGSNIVEVSGVDGLDGMILAMKNVQ
jgi:hypothetical protein